MMVMMMMMMTGDKDKIDDDGLCDFDGKDYEDGLFEHPPPW